MHQGAHARERHARKLRQRLLEQVDIAREQGPQNDSRGQLPGLTQVADERAHLAAGRDGGERDGRLFAGFPDDAGGAILAEPFARRHEAREGLRKLADQGLMGRGRQVLARQQGFADDREMAEAVDDAIKRERRNRRLRILDEHQAGLRRSDFGDGGRDRRRKVGTIRDCGLHFQPAGRHRVDEVGVDQ